MINILKRLNLWPDKIDLKAIFLCFLIINFSYLYHSLNFMWGNHDVVFVKERLYLTSGLFEGRFTQFIPHVLLTNGQILPILNNLIGFIFLAIALWILAKYWEIPKSILNYTLFGTFFATLPFTLSWLYFAFITISCLLWTMVIIIGLFLSALIHKAKNKCILSFVATLCFYLALGGYPPVINAIFVCLSAQCFISYVFKQKSFRNLINTHKYTILNIICAAILFKITLYFISTDDVYNLETTKITAMPAKFIATLVICLKQFSISLPFMSKTYKYILLAFTLCSFTTTVIYAFLVKRGPGALLLLAATVWFSALTTFLVVPHTEYVARIDFFGLAFVYAFALALFFLNRTPLLKSIGIFLGIFILIYNIINNYTAQKIWKQGFDAEFQILDDITERIENHPNFNPHKEYRFYQAGDITLRPAYYHKNFEQNEPFLLSLPYLAIWQGAPLVQFYSPFEYISKTPIIPTDITEQVYNFIQNEARPWPHQNAIFINNNILIIIYNQPGLDDFKQKIKEVYEHSHIR